MTASTRYMPNEVRETLDKALEQYADFAGESKKIVNICPKHHIALMKDTFMRSMYQGKPIVTDLTDDISYRVVCLVCSYEPSLVLVDSQELEVPF